MDGQRCEEGVVAWCCWPAGFWGRGGMAPGCGDLREAFPRRSKQIDSRKKTRRRGRQIVRLYRTGRFQRHGQQYKLHDYARYHNTFSPNDSKALTSLSNTIISCTFPPAQSSDLSPSKTFFPTHSSRASPLRNEASKSADHSKPGSTPPCLCDGLLRGEQICIAQQGRFKTYIV